MRQGDIEEGWESIFWWKSELVQEFGERERFSKFWTWGGEILCSTSVGILALYNSLQGQATYSCFFLQHIETNTHTAS